MALLPQRIVRTGVSACRLNKRILRNSLWASALRRVGRIIGSGVGMRGLLTHQFAPLGVRACRGNNRQEWNIRTYELDCVMLM